MDPIEHLFVQVFERRVEPGEDARELMSPYVERLTQEAQKHPAELELALTLVKERHGWPRSTPKNFSKLQAEKGIPQGKLAMIYSEGIALMRQWRRENEAAAAGEE